MRWGILRAPLYKYTIKGAQNPNRIVQVPTFIYGVMIRVWRLSGCAAMAFISIGCSLFNIWADVQRMRARHLGEGLKLRVLGGKSLKFRSKV